MMDCFTLLVIFTYLLGIINYDFAKAYIREKRKKPDPRKLTDPLMKLPPVTPDINNCSTAVISNIKKT